MYRGTLSGVLPLKKETWEKLEENGITKDTWVSDYDGTGMCFLSSENYNKAIRIIDEYER